MNRLILALFAAAVYFIGRLPFAQGLAPGAADEAAALAALGLLLLTGYLAGAISASRGIPRITGYMAAGILLGPYAMGVFTLELAQRLKLIYDIALILIALTAGGELRLKDLRGRWGVIGGVLAGQTAVIYLICFGALFAAGRFFLPALKSEPVQIAVTALIMGTLMTANSPSVAVAVIAETRAVGRLSDLIMAVTVVKDIAVIILFTIAIAAAISVMPTREGGVILGHLPLHIALSGSMLLGGLCGMVLIIYLKFVGRQIEIALLVMAVVLIRIVQVADLELLLTAMTVGFVVENFSRQGGAFIRGLERVSPPIYLVFFALSGAMINLTLLSSILPAALVWCVLRGVGLGLGTAVGLRLGGEWTPQTNQAWLGFLPQAGVTLGLTTIVAGNFPHWGTQLQTLILAVVAVNQVLGPIALRYTLRRAGETEVSY